MGRGSLFRTRANFLPTEKRWAPIRDHSLLPRHRSSESTFEFELTRRNRARSLSRSCRRALGHCRAANKRRNGTMNAAKRPVSEISLEPDTWMMEVCLHTMGVFSCTVVSLLLAEFGQRAESVHFRDGTEDNRSMLVPGVGGGDPLAWQKRAVGSASRDRARWQLGRPRVTPRKAAGRSSS